MDVARRPPEYILEVFADPTCVKEVVKAILHTIFFHRYFPSVRPQSRELLDVTLPVVDEVEVETLIEQRTTALIRQFDTSPHPGHGHGHGNANASVRGQMAVQFFEKRRRKAWFSKAADEEVCWEQWTLDVTLATPRTDSERAKVRRAMEMMLQKTAVKIVTTAHRDLDHIPPITTSDSNPFPYQIVINPRGDGWRLALF
ncbi:MAG: hypothetical protein M1826_004111 [Phylliscum demangeonii]|nr:MAG: hypothetical protein M1826_004111 [Phylliscum demangeonii]